MIVFSQPSLLAKNTIIGVGCILNAILSSPNPVTVKTGVNLESTLSLAPCFLFNKDLTLAYRVEGCEMTACTSSWVCQSIFTTSKVYRVISSNSDSISSDRWAVAKWHPRTD